MNALFAAEQPRISIGPEYLFQLGPLHITNTQMLMALGVTVLLVLAFAARRAVKRGSRSRFAHAALWIVESLHDTTIEVIGDKKIAQKVFPFAASLVLFFLVNNWLGILPFVGALKYHGTELFRGAAADMNTTFALAIMSMTLAQTWAIKRRGFFGNAKRYLVSPFKDPLHSFEGALEIVAEFSRTLALSLRIFGNVFGGEVLLAIIAYLTSWAAPLALPVFYVLELFVGAVQAYVFFMLTIAFISLGLPAGDEHGDAPAAGSHHKRRGFGARARAKPSSEQAA